MSDRTLVLELDYCIKQWGDMCQAIRYIRESIYLDRTVAQGATILGTHKVYMEHKE